MSRATLRTRLIRAFFLLLAVALGGSYLAMVAMMRRSALSEFREQALSLTQMLFVAGRYAVGVEDRTDTLIGQQMIAQAVLASHLVDVAENRAKMKPDEITAILEQIADRTVIDEFWITDDQGRAYLRNRKDIDFTFGAEGSVGGQSDAFLPLLKSRNGQAVQPAMARDYDGLVFKYAGVSGVDHPRIVQVGYDASTLRELSRGMHAHDLGKALVGNAGILGIQILGPGGRRFPEILAPNAPPGTLAQARAALSGELQAVFDTGQTRSVRRGDIVSFLVRARNHGGPNAVLISFDASERTGLIRRAALIMALMTAALLTAGMIAAVRIAGSIADPLHRFAREAREIGQGSFEGEVAAEGCMETRQLADSFNAMTRSLRQYVADLREATAARERIDSELRIASDVQRSMLPRELPRLGGVEVAAYSQPARIVGGDFYDVLRLPDGQLGLTIGDVAGKGLPAALLASQSLGLMRLASDNALSLRTLLERGNRLVQLAVHEGGTFVTMFCATYNPARGLLTTVDAGHPRPVLVRNGCPPEPLRLDSTFPLGIEDSLQATEQTTTLQSGDTVVFFTDGVTEARAPNGDLYGEDRLLACLGGCRACSADEVVRTVVGSVTAFAAGRDQSDDLTLVVLRVTGA